MSIFASEVTEKKLTQQVGFYSGFQSKGVNIQIQCKISECNTFPFIPSQKLNKHS